MNQFSKIDSRIFQVLVEQTRDYALFVLDPDGYVATWNVGAQRIKGYFADEIIGQHFSRFYLIEAVATGWPDHELKMATREGRFEDEGWRVRKDGSRFWASVVLTALRDEAGGLLGFSKITRDLTERKLQQEQLRQSEERFRLLIEGVADYAIYMLDPDGIVTSWNSGAERIKGYRREEILGSHFSRFYTESDIVDGKPWRELAEARREGRAEDEGWRLRKDGTRFWARVVVSALRDDNGHLRGFAKVTQDLTERKHAEDLEEAARNVQEFIATLAHEIRNPLAPIRSAVAAMNGLPFDDPNQASLRDMIDRQSAHLARIADDLIDITRITRGVLTIQKTPVRINEVIQRALEAAGPRIAQAQHTLESHCDSAAVVDGDADRLTQIITNLLNNAARYTPKGGSIFVTAVRDRRHVLVTIRDTGRGIEPAMLDDIFGMFVQGNAVATAHGDRGMGVGLALSRRLAEMHGGTLTVRSDGQGRGSEFSLRLPASEVRAIEITPPAPATADTSTSRKRILVVDDNVDVARSMELLLCSLGHEVHVVHDGQAALDVMPAFAADVVLLDIGMPGLDGYEVARRLQPLRKERPFQIVALTGWGQPPDRERTRQSGFDLHLVKPVASGDLEAVLSI